MRTRTEAPEFERDVLETRAGDVLRFVTGDGRGHAIAFDASLLADDAAAFLESTGQRRSPPLLTADATWIVDLADAPAGDYVVVCLVHGGQMRLHVQPQP